LNELDGQKASNFKAICRPEAASHVIAPERIREYLSMNAGGTPNSKGMGCRDVPPAWGAKKRQVRLLAEFLLGSLMSVAFHKAASL
jgi:hypothetical protein